MLVLVLSTALFACPLHPLDLDVALGQRSLPGLPPDLARQLIKHPKDFNRGAQAAAHYPQALHFRGGRGSVEEAVFAQAERLVRAIRNQTPFAEVTQGFGALAHLVVDLYYPVHGQDGKVFAAFLASRLPRVPVVYYAADKSLPFRPREDIWQSLLAVDSQVRPFDTALREDFARVGGSAHWNALDDRSTTFGIASITFNRAMTHYILLASWVWQHAGGLVPPFLGNGYSILVWKGELKPREVPLSRLRLR